MRELIKPKTLYEAREQILYWERRLETYQKQLDQIDPVTPKWDEVFERFEMERQLLIKARSYAREIDSQQYQ